MSTKSTTKIQYVLFGEVKVPIFKWKGYEQSWKELGMWCQEIGVSIEHHFEPDPIQPDWLTLFTGEKYSGGRGSSYRVLPGMYIVKLSGRWSNMMFYTREEVITYFRKIVQ